MYSTCLFCHRDLGRNEAIESFPVGRRLAFDAVRGRLWVVCARCGRWNLTPLEERWDAIEEAERAFRGTRLRISTDQIGLARLPEGLELIRIGEPHRPEMAAWRYGDQFGRRRRRAIVGSVLGVGAVGAAAVWGLPAIGLSGGLASMVYHAGVQYYVRRHVLARVRIGSGDSARVVRLTHHNAAQATLSRLGGDEWSLRTSHLDDGGRLRWSMDVGLEWVGDRALVLTGADARQVAARILPLLNGFAGRSGEVSDAVRLLGDAGSVDRLFAEASVAPSRRAASQWRASPTPGLLAGLPAAARLALEMATHEASERRAMEGELADLALAWRDAEEIAAIADDLLIPASVTDALDRLRR